MNAAFIKPLHRPSSTNCENLVKICSVVPEIDMLWGRPLKHIGVVINGRFWTISTSGHVIAAILFSDGRFKKIKI